MEAMKPYGLVQETKRLIFKALVTCLLYGLPCSGIGDKQFLKIFLQ